MDIVLISVHSVLEYDEIRLFERMGHKVFSLGLYFNRVSADGMRGSLQDTLWHEKMRRSFDATGCIIGIPDHVHYKVTHDFMDNFDVCIVHHNFRFIKYNWDVLEGRNVVWRTIGQELEYAEQEMQVFKTKGVKIARWSPAEQWIPHYIGHDAIIHAVKFAEDWYGWTGELQTVVTFANNIVSRRDSLNWDFYKQAVENLPKVLFGFGNEEVPWSSGALSEQDQISALRRHRCVFSTGTWPAPYTLTFVEAWMTGAPIIHVGREVWSRADEKCFEVDHLIDHGLNGFIVNSVEETEYYAKSLLADWELARKVSIEGRRKAVEVFGFEAAASAWSGLLHSFRPGNDVPEVTTVEQRLMRESFSI
jgi:glycosyltransferase involved in cell wall biosynthesis